MPLPERSFARWMSSPRAWLQLAGFVVGYTLLGMLGLMLQTAQSGVTPIWPASGFAFAVAFRFGRRYLLGIFPAMLLLALWAGVPLEAAVLAATGSLLEAAVPVYLLRARGITELGGLRSTLWFVFGGAVLGPLFSATLGVAGMALSGSLSLDAWQVWLLWWLGNSTGFLLVGGLVLATRDWRQFLFHQDFLGYALLVFLPVAGLGWLSSYWLGDIRSSLMLYLMMPLVAAMAIREGHFGVLLTGLVAVLAIILSSLAVPDYYLRAIGLGPLYLNISLLWLLSFTGLVVSAAWRERKRGDSYAWLAKHDSLTGLVNRHEFSKRLRQAQARIKGQGGEAVLMQLDLDDFKWVNDTMGHLVGDEVLQAVAEQLQAAVRSRDTVARIGGDEFMLLLENCSLAGAAEVAEKLRKALADFSLEDGARLNVTASIGTVLLSPDDANLDDLLRRVDNACYRAKFEGKARAVQST